MPIKFVDEVPPQVRKKTGKNLRIVEQLKQSPGKWADVARLQNKATASSRASILRRLGAEVTTRREGGKTVIYAMVVNGTSSAKKTRRKKS